jgi:nifR3 family TIM-barrel protein
MESFWDNAPLFVLAPMADVTDAAFRRVIAKYGKPDVMYTEFVSADGLYHTREIQKLSDTENPLMKDLLFSEAERPIVAQFFTAKPEMMEYAASLARKLGFDGVDINMGCPDRTIEKQGAGAGLIKMHETSPQLIHDLISAAKRGAGHVPVSVKTRIGYNKPELDTWLPVLLAAEHAAVIIHARTRKEMSLVPARWEHVRAAVEIRDRLGSSTKILGNGDVRNLEEANARVDETGCDGVMIGRGIFGFPWRFDTAVHNDDISKAEKLRVMLEHTRAFEELLPHKSFSIMKKHYKAYVSGWDGAKELRTKLMECKNGDEVEEIVRAHSTIAASASA